MKRQEKKGGERERGRQRERRGWEERGQGEGRGRRGREGDRPIQRRNKVRALGPEAGQNHFHHIPLAPQSPRFGGL